LFETPDLDFSTELVGELMLSDYEFVIPDEDSLIVTMPPIEREKWFPVIIRLLFCARGKRVTSTFFAELINRGALTQETLESFILTLETDPDTLNLKEIELFSEVYQRLRSAHSVAHSIKAANITNALVGYASDIEVPRADYIQNWLTEVDELQTDGVLMDEDLMLRFNQITLDKILSLRPQN